VSAGPVARRAGHRASAARAARGPGPGARPRRTGGGAALAARAPSRARTAR
jgi:hypothetical protein